MAIRTRSLPFVSAALVCALGLAGCTKDAAKPAARNPKVVVTTPISDTVIDYQDFTGRLDAFKTIEIRARVTGFVMEAPFKEGDLVKEGQLLFQIDRRPYQADLNQAVANLNVAIAERNLAEKNAERARKLPPTALSHEEFETIEAAYEKAKASVAAMESAKEKAELYLNYTKVTAPVTGRVSRRFVDPGNLINADNTVLTSIVAENPMYAYFDVDERTYLDLLSTVSPGQTAWSADVHLPVMIRLANEQEFAQVGYIDFVDNRIVATTGTVRMRGVFQNRDGRLKSGLFVRVRLPIGNSYKTLMIPDEAVQSDQERKYVWVVNSKNEAEYRSVEIGQSIGTLRVIRPAKNGQEGKVGLTEGERVIVAGMQRVRNGVVVDADKQAPPKPPQMALVRLLNEKQTGQPKPAP
jgi:RND family efflux transporter MFP subunit